MSKTTKEQRAKAAYYAQYHSALESVPILDLLDDLEAAEQELQRLREQTQWRPIDEMDDQSINRQSHLSNIEIH